MVKNIKSTKRTRTSKTITKDTSKPAGYRFTKRMGRYLFAAPSKTGSKKYDAFISQNGKWKKVASFGDRNYQQYKDRIGFYSSKNHNDAERRRRYQIRHNKDLRTEKSRAGTSAGYLSMRYLW